MVPFVLCRLPHRKVSEMGIFEDHDSSLRLGTFGSFAEVIGGVNTRPNSLSECDLQGVDGGLRRPAAPAAGS
jgi:hypothetical protein